MASCSWSAAVLVGIVAVSLRGRGAGAELVATARAAVRPSTVRVNFSSDPRQHDGLEG